MMTDNRGLPLRARVAAVIGHAGHIRGMPALARRICGSRGRFESDIGGALLSGDLASYIDKEAFLFRGYERQLIDTFFSRVPHGGTVIDVGANIGNHSVLFSQHFSRVIAFEPNPDLREHLQRNVRLNVEQFKERVIDLHFVGLGDEEAELPFFNINNGNFGLGTFSAVEQYDQPLQQTAVAQIVIGDSYLGDVDVAAIKVDVQGFEPNVLRGMQAILARSKPVVWSEVAEATSSSIKSMTEFAALFPYPVKFERFVGVFHGIFHRVTLEPVHGDAILQGDYIISPA